DLKNPRNVFPESDAPKYKVFSFVKSPDEYDEMGFPLYKENKDFLIKTEKYGVPQRRHRVILLGIREDIQHDSIRPLIAHGNETNLIQVIGSVPEIRSGIGRQIFETNINGRNIYRRIKNTASNWANAILDYSEKLDLDIRKQFLGLI